VEGPVSIKFRDKYKHLKLKVLEGEFKYALFSSSKDLWDNVKVVQTFSSDEPYFIFSTPDDYSMMIRDDCSVVASKEEPGWKAFRIIGDMAFGTVEGLIATISAPLKEKGLGLCIVSTFLTDYFFIREKNLRLAIEILTEKGWNFT
jgi:uncharacterized protein